ncbi:malate dehydrogenase, mitochondrial-like [Ctenocephalides felis]|uniref:malate dehydrogenase, mitochondrial-like n=1 Tax=Ctenocephalides felis TaxID=7515 RepID=UPI000E6E3248|nr:malate dehydrogenase, mitochondrial-like [Ctenocephalides felis]
MKVAKGKDGCPTCVPPKCPPPKPPPYVKVTVTGAASGCGRYCALMLKQCPLIDELALHDDKGCGLPAVALDLSHIDTRTTITAYEGPAKLKAAVKKADIVATCSGLPPNSHLTDIQLFELNASVVHKIALHCAEVCPRAMFCVITSPVTCLVPMVSEVYKKHCVYDPRRIFGVTSVSSMRANTLVSMVTGAKPSEVSIPLYGGYGRTLTVPVLSSDQSCCRFPPGQVDCLTKLIRDADDTICNMKNFKGAADLSQGFAAARFIVNIVKGIRVGPTCVDGAFVRQTIPDIAKIAPYLNTQVDVDCKGVVEYAPPTLSQQEQKMIDESRAELLYLIKTGESYVTCEHVSMRRIKRMVEKQSEADVSQVLPFKEQQQAKQ